MSAPFKLSSRKKENRAVVYLTNQEKEYLELLCDYYGLSISNMLRHIVKSEINRLNLRPGSGFPTAAHKH